MLSKSCSTSSSLGSKPMDGCSVSRVVEQQDHGLDVGGNGGSERRHDFPCAQGQCEFLSLGSQITSEQMVAVKMSATPIPDTPLGPAAISGRRFRSLCGAAGETESAARLAMGRALPHPGRGGAVTRSSGFELAKRRRGNVRKSLPPRHTKRPAWAK